ncbi:hypothetical protein K2X85_16170 [bacterium]|nr:hypothetical protein [bacterium]
MKKISFNTKPTKSRPPNNADAWVENRELSQPEIRETMKRLTVDVPLSLHKRIKSHCAMANLIMADEIRDLLEKRFPGPKDSEPTSIPAERISS